MRVDMKALMDGPYALTKIKTFRGMEGSGINAFLTKNGKVVCDLVDEGCGGDMHWGWWDMRAGESTEETAFLAFIETKRTLVPDEIGEFGLNDREMFGADTWVNLIVDHMAQIKKWKREAKTFTLCQIGAEIGGDRYWKYRGTDERVRESIKAKHAGQPIRFINDEVA